MSGASTNRKPDRDLLIELVAALQVSRNNLRRIPVGRTTWWEGVKSGRFPKPMKLGPRITVWRAEEIRRLFDHGAI